MELDEPAGSIMATLPDIPEKSASLVNTDEKAVELKRVPDGEGRIKQHGARDV